MTALSFVATSRASGPTGWAGQGTGCVRVEAPSAETLHFHEQGTWTTEGGRELRFHNVYRWTLTEDEQVIRLEHLRFGAAQPVYLFDLVPAESEGALVSREPHVCREDRYFCRLEYGGEEEGIRLTWTVTGPGKDESIVYRYR